MRGSSVQRDDFRDDLPVSRGQWRALARAALHRLGEGAPESRMDATELLVRFRRGEDAAADPATNGLTAVADAAGNAR
jgi:hypothetical protein